MNVKGNIWKTKVNMEKMRRGAIFALVVFSLIILAALGYSLVGIRQTSISETTNYVQNLTKQLTNTVDLEISGRRVQLVSVGDSFEQVVAKKDDEAVQEFITRKQKLCGFDFIVLEDTRSGRTAMAGTLPEEYTDGVSVLHSLETSQKARDEGVCEVGIENENVICAMPLYDEAGHIGFIWAGNTAESMRDIIHLHSFRQRIYSCIIDKNGDIILSADKREQFKNLETVFKEGKDAKLQKNLKEMEKNIAKDKSGIFSFVTEDSHEVYLAYNSMDESRWIMLTIVPTDLLSADYGRFVYLASAAVIGTLLVFMCFFIILTQIYRHNRKRLEQLAYSDDITGGGNNQAFCLEYRHLYRKKGVKGYAVVLLDVVNFKEINKKFGAKQGDEILRYIYEVICGSLDKDRGEFAARSEMDHFFICLKEGQEEGIQKRLDDITTRIDLLDKVNLPNYQIFFRMAAVFATEKDRDPIMLEDKGRSILKMSEAVPGKCVFYSRELERRIHREQELDDAFESALAAEEFHVYFQPKVSVGKGSIEGAEALVRWLHPKWGVVPPGDFIPMLEGNGKIVRLDKYVFEKVCRWIKKRENAGEPDIPISVNLSRSNLMDENFFAWFAETADRYEVRHDLIEFELTESTFMVRDQIQQMRDYINQMHELDFRVSIDDFGIGYSSISLLGEFDVDVFKLDRTFFIGLDSPKSQNIISCIVDLAEKLDVGIVVEGIETMKQIEYLQKLRCDVVQGYFFSKPLPENEFEQWYSTFDFNKYGV